MKKLSPRYEGIVESTLDDIGMMNAMSVEGMEYNAAGFIPKRDLNSTPVTYNAMLEERPVIKNDSFINMIIRGAIFR